jgi:hypothetical protein
MPILTAVKGNFYRFRSRWDVDAPEPDVFAALDAMEQYPEWWQEVRAVERLDAGKYRLHVRSLLPYDLTFIGTEWERDAQAGVLSIRMEGDLEGFSRWTISPGGSMTTVTFDEEVVANKTLLRRLSLVGRPAFKWNHALMMRHCRSGLRACLAGIRLARSDDDGEQRQD